MNSTAEWLLSPELSQRLAQPSQLDDAFLEGLRPDPDLTISQWADTFRQLPSEAAAEHGQWRTSRVEFMREIMDAQSPSHPCTASSLMKGTQIAASESMYNVLGYCMHLCPSPGLMIMPTIDLAKLTSKQRIQPMIDATPVLMERVSPSRSRDSGNTVLLKKYPGGLVRFTGANSGVGLRSMPARFIWEDEVDGYPDDVDGEGDPCALAEKRATNFGSRKKIFRASSPKLKGKSRIERFYKAGTQARYYVPCPHCAHEQWLRWEQMRWEMRKVRKFDCRECGAVNQVIDDSALVCTHCNAAADIEQVDLVETGEVSRAWYECESCQGEIDERRHKTAMLDRGRHIHHVPGPGRLLDRGEEHIWAIWVKVGSEVRRYLPTFERELSWHVSALYSPVGWYSWLQAVTDYLESEKGGYHEESGESLKQVFRNTALGETYELAGEQQDANILSTRAEPYELGTVPAGGLMLVAFADVQGNRLEFKCKAYGRDDESWLVDYQVIHGDPDRDGPDSVWAQLIQLRDRTYAHAGGTTMRITAMGVDSGYKTQVVYDFCRKWSRKHVIATKGDAGPGKTAIGPERKVDYNHKGKGVKNGAALRIIGVHTVKERVFSNLEIVEAGPGCMHFPAGLPNEYFEQLTSEKKVAKRKKGVVTYEYIKTRERNEALDLEVGCYAVAVFAGMKRVDWNRLDQVYNPKQRDIFSQPAEQAVQTPAQQQQPKAADAVMTKVSTDAAATNTPKTRPAARQDAGWIQLEENWLQ